MRIRDGLVQATSKAKGLGVVDLALRYNPPVRRKVRHCLDAFQAPDLAQRQSLSDRLTDGILRRARQTRYGRAFGDALAAWPVLTKERLRADPMDFVVPGLVRVPASTGGTTGVPLRLQRSLSSVAAEQAFLDGMLGARGLNWATARVAVLRGDAVKDIADQAPPFARETHWGRRLILSSPHLTAEHVDWFVDRLTAFRPDILCAWPNMIANLLMLLSRSGRRLRLPLVVASSSMLDAALYRAIGQALGADIVDYYGLAERSALAVRRGEEEWFFEPAYGRVELLPCPDDAIDGDRREMAIIATGYWNRAQPLVRYDTGDRAIVPASYDAAELAAVTMGLRAFVGLAGRSNEFLVAPDGRRISGLSMITYEVRNLLQLQLVQDAPDHVTMLAIATPAFSSADRERLMENARKKIPFSLHIAVEVVDALETTARGKTPFIIRRFAEPPSVLRAAE